MSVFNCRSNSTFVNFHLQVLDKIEQNKLTNDIVKKLQIDSIELFLNDPKGYFNIGNGYCNDYDYESAIRCYKNAVKINPNYTEAYRNMSSAYQKLGKNDECNKCLEKAEQVCKKLNISW